MFYSRALQPRIQYTVLYTEPTSTVYEHWAVYSVYEANFRKENSNLCQIALCIIVIINYKVLKVPYVGKPSILFARKMRKVLQNIIDDNVRIVYTTNKVGRHFRVKDADPKDLLTHVVYGFKCRRDSEILYVGYTNRTLKQRVNEHVSGGTRVSDHIAVCDTCKSSKITTDDFQILKKSQNWLDTSVHEALLIKRLNPPLNIQLSKPGYTHQLRIFSWKHHDREASLSTLKSPLIWTDMNVGRYSLINGRSEFHLGVLETLED